MVVPQNNVRILQLQIGVSDATVWHYYMLLARNWLGETFLQNFTIPDFLAKLICGILGSLTNLWFFKQTGVNCGLLFERVRMFEHLKHPSW